MMVQHRLIVCVVSALPLLARADGLYDNEAWNRVHVVLMTREATGQIFGQDNAVPFLDSDSIGELTAPPRLKDALAALDAFIAQNADQGIDDPVRRAIFQHDLWGVFDHLCVEWVGHEPQQAQGRKALRGRIATIIRRLAAEPAAKLPDNYDLAVKSGQFGAAFDPAKPERAFLPHNLFTGGWVEIGAHPFVQPLAAGHAEALDGRSAFRVFMLAPDGRQATLAYLDKLNLHRTPFRLEPAGIFKGNMQRLERTNPLQLDPDTPQPPPGTMVALARTMLSINDRLEIVKTPIVQSVQFRMLAERKAGERGNAPAFEIVMRRSLLFAGKAGGLRAMEKDEAEHQMVPFGRPHGHEREKALRGPVVLSTCSSCHGGNGVHSVLTYAGMFGNINRTNPQLLPADNAENHAQAMIYFKSRRYDWGLLKGLLEAKQ